MHNWHAMKFAPEVEAFGRDEKDASMPGGTISIGTRMAKSYGKDLVVIGNIVPKAVCKNPICKPPPVRADSLETPFQQFLGNKPMLVDARKLPILIKIYQSIHPVRSMPTLTRALLLKWF